ncbi:MAG: hypothetical protein IBX44_09215 [Sulfurospirillum sp.]|nr:hypothetical protein [Sulfurospirillum sp.]
MSSFVSQSQVISAIFEGIDNAKENFLFWTNNRLFLSHGPRKIITLHVAMQIGKLQNPPEIFIDATVSDILRCSLHDRKAYTQFMQKSALAQGIFSITLDERFVHQNDNDSISRVIISIKNGVRSPSAEYANEIERICKMLDRTPCKDSTLDYGVFAFYADLSCNARKKLEKRLPELAKSFDAIVERFTTLQSRFVCSPIQKVTNMGEWCSGCYIIEPKIAQ